MYGPLNKCLILLRSRIVSPIAIPIRCLGSFSVEKTPYGRLCNVKSLNSGMGMNDIFVPQKNLKLIRIKI